MLEARCQSPIAKATADLMGAWALAASTPAIQVMSFWTRMLGLPVKAPVAAPVAAPPTPAQDPQASTVCDAERGTPEAAPADGETAADVAQSPPAAESSPEPGFASYRSSGGHAVAQVIVSES